MMRSVWTLVIGAALFLPIPAFGQAPASTSAVDPLRITPVVEAYRKASPAVVNISTERLVRTGPFGGEGDPFEEFFPQLFGRTVPAVSLGSGFLIHADGYIVTNAHVVRRAQKITATLADKSAFDCEVVAANPAHDLAVLKVADPKGRKFPFLRLGRSDDLMIGETAIAIGNPMGYQNTCTTGVISALDRQLDFAGGVAYKGLIQTDTAINPGNSGGPLLNITGQLIGITSAIRADAQGICFAIPTDHLTADLAHLLDFERLNRVIVGLGVEQHHAQAGDEIVVAAVAEGSPAHAASLKVGDRLVGLNGHNLTQLPDYLVPLLGAKGGDKLKLRLERAGKPVEAEVAVKARPKPDAAMLAQKLLGLEVRQVTPELARQLHLPVEDGLLIVGVEPGGPSEKLGIRRQDVLFQLGRWYVTDMDRLGAVLEDVGGGQAIGIGIIRGNTRALTNIQTRVPQTGPASQPTSKSSEKIRV